MKVSAVIVSRIDHPIGEVIDSIAPHVEEIIVVRGHDGVWERWEAIARAKCDVVYMQDDDAIVDVPAVLAAYEPGKVTCNMPEDHRRDYPDGIALVGWGCVFGQRMPISPFERYQTWAARSMPAADGDAVFLRETDRIVTSLSPLKLIDVPIRHLPHAHGEDRMGREQRHGDDLREIRRRIYAIRAAK
jgi:hypothetical protein